jgi:hypothetical protein
MTIVTTITDRLLFSSLLPLRVKTSQDCSTVPTPHLTISTSRCRCLPEAIDASMVSCNNVETSEEFELDDVSHLPLIFLWLGC